MVSARWSCGVPASLLDGHVVFQPACSMVMWCSSQPARWSCGVPASLLDGHVVFQPACSMVMWCSSQPARWSCGVPASLLDGHVVFQPACSMVMWCSSQPTINQTPASLTSWALAEKNISWKYFFPHNELWNQPPSFYTLKSELKICTL